MRNVYTGSSAVINPVFRESTDCAVNLHVNAKSEENLLGFMSTLVFGLTDTLYAPSTSVTDSYPFSPRHSKSLPTEAGNDMSTEVVLSRSTWPSGLVFITEIIRSYFWPAFSGCFPTLKESCAVVGLPLATTFSRMSSLRACLYS